MTGPKHDSHDTAQSGKSALPADVVESARSGNRASFAHIVEYAREGNTDAIAFLMERCQIGRDQTACAFLEGRLQRDDPAVLAFLVERAQQEDRSAFAYLYDRYALEICTYLIRHTGNEELGRDLMQDTFVKAMISLPKSHVDTRARFRSWLFKIAENVRKDYFKKKNHVKEQALEMINDDEEVVVVPEAQDKLSTKESPEEIVAGLEYIRLALKEVGPQNRAALLMQAFQPGSQHDLANLLNINEGTFSGYLSRGRKDFQDAYTRLENEQDH